MNDLEISGGSLTALLHSGDALPPMMRDIFLVKQSIVGTRFLGGSEDLVEDLAPGSKVTLLREPDNRFDDRAVMALDGEGRKLGYIPRRENGVISALMDAGKLLYGIVSGEPHKRDESNPASSYSLWIDLYMREYVSPMDLTSIPRQGAQASYAVTAPVFGKKSGDLRGFHALRVINGEERGQIRIDFGGEHGRERRKEALAAFDEFAGCLPIVGHGIEETLIPALELDYGLLLGKPFSNRVIDTGRMAANHLPEEPYRSLEALAFDLGIDVSCEDSAERECRIVWELYRRMDRSALEKRDVRALPGNDNCD